MTDTLGPLPEPFMELHRELSPHVYAAWAEQMRAYAIAEVAKARADERERCAKVCEDLERPNGCDASVYDVATLDCASAIRALS